MDNRTHAMVNKVNSEKQGEGKVPCSLARLDLLCADDRDLMLQFSGRCIQSLGRYLPLRLFLSTLRHFIEANVNKEISKNRVVIGHAAAVFSAGRGKGNIDLEALLGATREFDREFLRDFRTPFLSIHLRHDDVAETRRKRISAHAGLVFDLLDGWQETEQLADAIRKTYDEKAYREILGGMLHLYNMETRALSNSITLHGPAAGARDFFAEKLFSVMEETARETAINHARGLYADEASRNSRESAWQA